MASNLKSFNPNKDLKEQIFYAGALPCDYYTLRSNAAESSLKKNDDEVVQKKSQRAYIATMIVDFLFILVPFISFLTVLSEWIYLNATLVILLLLIFFSSRRNGSSFFQEDDASTFRRNVSSYVSMVYANMTLGNAFSSCTPLILLGFTRLLFTYGVDYQVHVGQYGVHWNFFFTLAGVIILTSVINVPSRYCGPLGFFVLLGYQFSLLHGLNDYLLSDKGGTDVIRQNKEGIYSVCLVCQ